INNIGLDGGAHYSTQLELQPKRLRRQFTMSRHEMQFPLSHPQDVVEEPGYQARWYLRNAWNNPWRKVQYSLEELWLNLCKGNFRFIFASILNRIKKTLG
ncbi:MAG: hemolysin activation protein, partial [Prevotella sp.]|nr:hemolysin activation protein [Prevotella sp.]